MFISYTFITDIKSRARTWLFSCRRRHGSSVIYYQVSKTGVHLTSKSLTQRVGWHCNTTKGRGCWSGKLVVREYECCVMGSVTRHCNPVVCCPVVWLHGFRRGFIFICKYPYFMATIVGIRFPSVMNYTNQCTKRTRIIHTNSSYEKGQVLINYIMNGTDIIVQTAFSLN